MNIDFLGSNRQFDSLELSLLYDRSDKHTTIYDCLNVELAEKTKSIKSTNFTEIYSIANEKKYDVDNLTQKQLCCINNLVTWSCNGCREAPLTDYTNNAIYQELIGMEDYFETKSNKRIYFDLRAISG